MLLSFISKIIKYKRAKCLRIVDLYVGDGRFKVTLGKFIKFEKVFYVVRFHGGFRTSYRISQEKFRDSAEQARKFLNVLNSGEYIDASVMPKKIIELPYVESVSEKIGLFSILMKRENIKYSKNIFSTDKNIPIIDIYICGKNERYFCVLSMNIDWEAKNIYNIELSEAALFCKNLLSI